MVVSQGVLRLFRFGRSWLASRDKTKFDAAVLRPAFFGFVGCQWLAFSEAERGQTTSIDTMCDEIFAHSIGTTLSQ